MVPVFEIPVGLDGKLFIMPKPDAEDLSAQMAQFVSMGISEIVSLMEVNEMTEVGLGEEGAQCVLSGMQFTSFPIQDFGLPDAGQFLALADRIREDLKRGHSVAIHCKGGIGRSGMLSSLIYAPFIGSAEQAIADISRARGTDVPDTDEQRAFVIAQFRKTQQG